MFFDSARRGHAARGAVFAWVHLLRPEDGLWEPSHSCAGAPRHAAVPWNPRLATEARAPRLISARVSCNSRVLSDAEQWFHSVPILLIRDLAAGAPPPHRTCLAFFFVVVVSQYNASLPLSVFKASGHCEAALACTQPTCTRRPRSRLWAC